MSKELNIRNTQHVSLLRSIYALLAPVMILIAVLACGTVITDGAYYTCPTSIPQPTATLLPGVPLPPPDIPPTPYTISAPQDFYIDDAIFVGQQGAPLRLRFRLQNVQSEPADGQHLVTWQLEIHNAGTLLYETVPPALMLITRITTAHGEQDGTWYTSESAMQRAGFTQENYAPLSPGETRVYSLAGTIPAGSVSQFTYLLDGDGNNRITWTNESNPYCSGDVAG